MNPDRDDPVLDACLDEVLGGRTPPDLTERILAAWNARNEQRAAAMPDQEIEVPPVLASAVLAGIQRAVQPPPINGHPVVELAANAGEREAYSFRRWPLSAVALGTIGLALA